MRYFISKKKFYYIIKYEEMHYRTNKTKSIEI